MPYADFCPAVRVPLDTLSHRSDTGQLSWGKLNRLPCTIAGSTLCIFDGSGLRGKSPARPTLTPPIRFLSIDSHVFYIFGDNIEDYLGHFRYLLFYLGTGVVAAGVHYVFNAGSSVPTVGASGAIAGVMGAYLILYPSARVLTFVPLFFIFFFWLPAWVVLGFWFFGQFLSGAATALAVSHQTGGGIAVWAHVGGFIAGVAIIKMFPSRPRRYKYFYR